VELRWRGRGGVTDRTLADGRRANRTAADDRDHAAGHYDCFGNQAFSPNPVRANAGDTVMFRNSDSTLHHLVLDDGSMDFGDIAPGSSSRGVVLRNANPLTFHCTLHATMVGSINGLTAPETPPCVPDSYGYGC
jgi:plastocyanin